MNRDDSLPPAPSGGRWLSEVVLEAADLDGAEREAYLCDVAASDPELAAHARRRLATSLGLPDSFLNTPAAALLDGVAVDAQEPASGAALPARDRYELGECLGEGGMGRVLLAFDRQLGRSVALKFLTHQDPAILRLFLREARAQARVEHPHVLDIYDSGELDGRPFIAMRYISGGTLAQVPATLSLEQKVRLLVQVALGLHAAHHHGLLHRDVKPSNILVDETDDGELMALVTDFGLATELGDGDTLVAATVAGSPHYIAPERLAGATTPRAPATVDRRSDVYSLGITMYWLLTGAVPFAQSDTVAVLRQVLREEVPPARQYLPTLPVELDAILQRCVAHDPDRRYASARAVAADLERFLDGEVVEAYTASLAYRLTRFVLRNKLLAGMAAVAGVALLVASVAVTVFALRADAARQRAQLRQGQAEELIRFMVVDLHEELESVGRLDVLDHAGGAAMEYFAAVPAEDLGEDDLLRQSRMLYQIGSVRIKQGDLVGAAAPMEESLALARRLAQLRPDDGERLFELGQSHFWVGFVHWEQGDLVAARAPFEAYVEVAQRLVEKDPSNLAWRRELSYAYSNFASLLEAEGDLEGALEHFLATLAIDQELVAADPTDGDAQSELAATHNTVGVVLEALGRLSEAGEHLRADLEIRRAQLRAEPADPRAREFFGASLGHLGMHFLMQGELSLAGEHFERMQEIFARLVEHDPANTAWRFRLVWSHLELGRVAFAHGEIATASAAWRVQRQMIDELLALDATPHIWRRTRATGLYHLALLQQARGDPAARDTILTTVEILEDLAAARPTDRRVHRWLSRSYLLLGTLEGSASAATAAFARAAETIEPFARGGRDGRVLALWAEALHCLGRFEEARPVFETVRALGYAEPNLGPFCRSEESALTPGPSSSMSSPSKPLR